MACGKCERARPHPQTILIGSSLIKDWKEKAVWVSEEISPAAGLLRDVIDDLVIGTLHWRNLMAADFDSTQKMTSNV